MGTLSDRHDDNHDNHEPEARPKRPPYAQMPHYVLNRPGLSDGDLKLYAHLDTFWRANKDWCNPKQETLAARMDVKNVCTVHRRAKKLEAAGLIKVVRQGLNKPNKYVRLPPPPPICTRSQTPTTATRTLQRCKVRTLQRCKVLTRARLWKLKQT